jgi:hypothetical protein
MTQVEFENELRELRCQKVAAINAIASMQGEVKEEIASINRQIKDLLTRREKLNQQRIIYSNQRLEREREFGEKICKFINDNQTECREFESVSDWALAKELNRRGFSGNLKNDEKSPEFLTTFNNKINGTWNDGEEQKEE